MKESSDECFCVDYDSTMKPLMVKRMQKLLNATLSAAGSFEIKCPTQDCDWKISPLRYAVYGPDLEHLSLCCVECAESSDEPLRRKIVMPRKRALVYMYHSGTNINTTCALCEMTTAPINVITSYWEMAHKVSDKLLGKNKVNNLFPAHPACNTEQHTRSLYEVRESSGFMSPPFPDALGSIKDAEKARHVLLR